MENQKELNCSKCLHKAVCKNIEVNKQSWEALVVNQDYQRLINNGMDFIVSCKQYYPIPGKIIKGE